MIAVRTSGTTGRHKSFTLTESQIAARVADLARIRPPGWTDLTILYNDLSAAGPGVQRDTRWMSDKGGKLFRPLATFDDTVKQFVDNGIQGILASPLALARFAKALKGSSYRPRIVIAAGSLLTPGLSRTIRDGLGDNLWTAYTTSETGTVSLASAAQAEAIPGCVGKLCKAVEARIVNGEIQVRTPIMIAGYDDPKMTSEKFVNGWLRTGDRGYFAADGCLIYQGRLKT